MTPGRLRTPARAALGLLLTTFLEGCASPGPGSGSAGAARTAPTVAAPVPDDPEPAAAPAPPERLERRLGLEVGGRLEPGDRRLFALYLDEGEYLEVHLDPGPEEARIDLFVPGVEPGRDGSEAASSGEHAPDTAGQILWEVVTEGGVHQLRVEPAAGRPATFRMELQALRPASDRDLGRARCRRKMEEGDRLRSASRLEEALAQYKGAEEGCESGEYLGGIAALKARRGQVHRWIGQLDEARRERESALALRRRLGDRRNVYWNLISLADIETQTGQWDAADQYLDGALELAREFQDPVLEAISEFYRCALVSEKGPDLRARTVCKPAASQLREVGPRSLLGPAVNILAEIEYSQGSLEAARTLYLEAFDLARANSDESLRAAVSGGLAVLALAEGQFDDALARYQESLELYRLLGNRAAAAEALSRIGDLHERLGNLDSAVNYFRQALEGARELGQPRPQIQMLLNIGEVLQQRGDLEGARLRFEEALKLSRRSGSSEDRASVLQRMGAFHLADGEPHDAQIALAQALEECQRAGNPWREAVVLAELARAHSALGQLDRGFELLAQAAAINSRLGNRTRVAENHYRMARLEWQRGDWTAAKQTLDRALAVAEAVRPLVGGGHLSAFFTETTRPYYELRIALLMDRERVGPGSGQGIEALRESERARARSLLEILVQANLEPASDVSEELLAERNEIQKRLQAKEIERQGLLGLEEPDSTELTRVNIQIEGLLTKLRDLERRMRGESTRYAALTSTEPVTVGEIQETVLDPDTTLLEFWLGEEESFLWAVTDQEFRSYRLPGRDEIESEARCLHWLVSAYGEPPSGEDLPTDANGCLAEAAASYRAASAESHPLQTRALRRQILEATFRTRAARLSEILLAPPARDGLLRRRLALVSDGALEYVPFAALPEPGTGQEPLVRRHQFVRLPSASVLAFQRSREEAPRQERGVLAVIADPVYAADDRRIASDTRGIASGLPGEGAPAETQALSFRRLDFAGREAEAIASLVPPDQVFVARGPSASRETVLTTDLSGYRYVHFAAHGVIDTQYPQLSGLVLSLVDPQGSRRENGFLRLHDVYGMDLEGVDTVVLSACETALGREIRGEGLVGLTRGFLYAGADRVVASLWPVQDLATAQLMEEFYTQLLRRGRSPGQALRHAQTALLDDPDNAFAHPYFWAGFVLQGEWR